MSNQPSQIPPFSSYGPIKQQSLLSGFSSLFISPTQWTENARNLSGMIALCGTIWFLTTTSDTRCGFCRCLSRVYALIVNRTAFHQGGHRGIGRELLLTIVSELAIEYHSILTEVAQMCDSVQKSLGTVSVPMFEGSNLEGVIMSQNFEVRLRKCDTDVFAKHGVLAEDVKAAVDKFTDDVQISLRVLGMKSMYSDSMKGLLPLLPGMSVKEELTEENVLKLYCEISASKSAEMANVVKGRSIEFTGGLPPASLASEIHECNKKAEDNVIDKTEGIKKIDYMNAMAHYMRDPLFRQKRHLLDAMHSQESFKMMQKVTKPEKPKDAKVRPVMAALHTSLEEVISTAELEILLQTSDDASSVLVCGCFSADLTITFIGELSEKIDEIVASAPDRNISFVYMTVEDPAEFKNSFDDLKTKPFLLESTAQYCVFHGKKLQSLTTSVGALKEYFYSLGQKSASDTPETIVSTEALLDASATAGD